VVNEKDKRIREERVLEIVIQSYILTGTPVSSRYVSRKLDLSSATIRNIMADLEDTGFINHPHTSAGRVPTDKGYRLYVDSLMRLKKIADKEIDAIRAEYRSKLKSLEDMFEKTAHILSNVTNCAGLILFQNEEQGFLKHINLVLLSKKNVLVSLELKTGFIKDYIIEIDYPAAQILLDEISNFLNKELYNMTLKEIKDYLVKNLEEEREVSYRLVETAYEIMVAILMEGLHKKLYFDGTSHILAYPEFKDQRKLESVLKFFEDRETISNILSGDLEDDNLKIYIGSESGIHGFDELSLITAGFKFSDKNAGKLGVIGPTRMDYDRVVPIVDLLSNALTKILSFNE